MALIDRMRKQTAVYWGSPKPDGFGGVVFDPPREISVRWEQSASKFTDPSGQEQVSKAKVYVGEDLALGGFLMLGELSQLAPGTKPSQVTGAMSGFIRQVSSVPDLKARRYLRSVYL